MANAIIAVGSLIIYILAIGTVGRWCWELYMLWRDNRQ